MTGISPSDYPLKPIYTQDFCVTQLYNTAITMIDDRYAIEVRYS